VLLHRFPEGAVIPDRQADAIDAVKFNAGADAIERRIYCFRQVQCRVAGQILRCGEASLDLPLLGRELDTGLSVDTETGDVADWNIGAKLKRRRRGVEHRTAA